MVTENVLPKSFWDHKNLPPTLTRNGGGRGLSSRYYKVLRQEDYSESQPGLQSEIPKKEEEGKEEEDKKGEEKEGRRVERYWFNKFVSALRSSHPDPEKEGTFHVCLVCASHNRHRISTI